MNKKRESKVKIKIPKTKLNKRLKSPMVTKKIILSQNMQVKTTFVLRVKLPKRKVELSKIVKCMKKENNHLQVKLKKLF